MAGPVQQPSTPASPDPRRPTQRSNTLWVRARVTRASCVRRGEAACVYVRQPRGNVRADRLPCGRVVNSRPETVRGPAGGAQRPGSRQRRLGVFTHAYGHRGPAIRLGSADPAPGSVSGNTHKHTLLSRSLSLSLSLSPSLPPSLPPPLPPSLSLLPCFSLLLSLSHFSFCLSRSLSESLSVCLPVSLSLSLSLTDSLTHALTSMAKERRAILRALQWPSIRTPQGRRQA
jgi:hypothetical protein